MALRSFLEANVPESLQQVELAATDRIAEGRQLIASGFFGGGIYLLGYAGEMLLKCACARYNDASLTSDLQAAFSTLLAIQFGSVRLGKAVEAYVSNESRHSIQFWAEVLIAVRSYRGNAYDDEFLTNLKFYTQRLYGNWWVEMRYRPDHATAAQARDCLADVGWLNANFSRLYAR